jgi:hypothetical protein
VEWDTDIPSFATLANEAFVAKSRMIGALAREFAHADR